MSPRKKIDVRFGSLFPWPFLLIAGILLVVGLSLIGERTLVALALIIICGFVLTSSEGTEINLSAKNFTEYKSFFFIKSGTRKTYSSMEKIFINTSKTRQQLYTAHTTKSSIFENLEYNAFLKFTDGTKVHLLKKRKKEDLLKKIDNLAKALNVQVEDHTITNASR
jgi:hypothetical protein